MLAASIFDSMENAKINVLFETIAKNSETYETIKQEPPVFNEQKLFRRSSKN